MEDLFQPPFHKELHEIMIKKGYHHVRMYDGFYKGSYDHYIKDGRILDFWEDEYIVMTEANGGEASIDIFIQETDGIFDPDKVEH